MAVVIRGRSDGGLETLAGALERYQEGHSRAEVVLYRQNPVSVRIRVVDPDFAGRSRPERNREVWGYFDEIPERVVADISSLLLLTPDETATSFANVEFDDPVPSKL